MMTVAELIERLEDLNPDSEVFIQQQPNYPLKGALVGVCTEAECKSFDDEFEDREEDETDETDEEDADEQLDVVYLVSGPGTEYGNRAAWDCCG